MTLPSTPPKASLPPTAPLGADAERSAASVRDRPAWLRATAVGVGAALATLPPLHRLPVGATSALTALAVTAAALAAGAVPLAGDDVDPRSVGHDAPHPAGPDVTTPDAPGSTPAPSDIPTPALAGRSRARTALIGTAFAGTAGLLVGLTTGGSLAVDRAVHRALVRRGVRAPRAWMGLGAGVIAAVLEVADPDARASAGSGPRAAVPGRGTAPRPTVGP